MTRRTAIRLLTGAIAFDAVAVLALLMIGTFGVLHTESGFYDSGSIESRLVDLWGLWGLVPGFLVTMGAAFAFAETEGR